MAFGGRVKSGLPLLSKLFRSEPLSNPTRLLSRNYAAATGKTEVNVTVPLPMFGIDGNYASALYLAAVKSNLLEKVETEVLDFLVASKKSPRFTEFAKDPTVHKDIRVKAMESITTDAKFSDITRNFLLVVAQNGRFKILDDIVRKFHSLTMAHKGEVKVIVTVTNLLSADEEKELKETMQERLKGKKIILEQKIDPRILGGLVVEYDQKIFDMSIRNRASQMEKYLRDPAILDLGL